MACANCGSEIEVSREHFASFAITHHSNDGNNERENRSFSICGDCFENSDTKLAEGCFLAWYFSE